MIAATHPRIGVNALFLALGPYGGLETYAREIVRELPALAPDAETVVFAPPRTAGTWPVGPNLREAACAPPTAPDRRVQWAGRVAYEYAALPRRVRAAGCGVLWSPCFTAPAPRGFASVVTVPDMQHTDLPHLFPAAERVIFLALLRRAVASAAHILTLSEHAKRRIVAHYGVSPERVTITAPAAAAAFFAPPDASAVARVRGAYGLPGRYLLSVATLHAHKNLDALIAAFAALREAGDARDVRLLLVGGRGTAADTLAARVAERGLTGEVLLPGYVPDGDLHALYAGATAFVLPSRYEGFGIPVVEAMASGTPVVTTTATSLPEVAGDAALLFDPDDRAALFTALRHLLRDDALRATLIERGRRRARHYAWRTAADATLRVLRAAENDARGGGACVSR